MPEKLWEWTVFWAVTWPAWLIALVVAFALGVLIIYWPAAVLVAIVNALRRRLRRGKETDRGE